MPAAFQEPHAGSYAPFLHATSMSKLSLMPPKNATEWPYAKVRACRTIPTASTGPTSQHRDLSWCRQLALFAPAQVPSQLRYLPNPHEQAHRYCIDFNFALVLVPSLVPFFFFSYSDSLLPKSLQCHTCTIGFYNDGFSPFSMALLHHGQASSAAIHPLTVLRPERRERRSGKLASVFNALLHQKVTQ